MKASFEDFSQWWKYWFKIILNNRFTSKGEKKFVVTWKNKTKLEVLAFPEGVRGKNLKQAEFTISCRPIYSFWQFPRQPKGKETPWMIFNLAGTHHRNFPSLFRRNPEFLHRRLRPRETQFFPSLAFRSLLKLLPPPPPSSPSPSAIPSLTPLESLYSRDKTSRIHTSPTRAERSKEKKEKERKKKEREKSC